MTETIIINGKKPNSSLPAARPLAPTIKAHENVHKIKTTFRIQAGSKE